MALSHLKGQQLLESQRLRPGCLGVVATDMLNSIPRGPFYLKEAPAQIGACVTARIGSLLPLLFET